MSEQSIEKSPEFKNAFWAWFDSLTSKEKEKFWYFSVDMATTYFYNKYYSKSAPLAQLVRGA